MEVKVLCERKAVRLVKVTLEDGSYRYKVSDDCFGHRASFMGKEYDIGVNKDFYSLHNALSYFKRITEDDAFVVIMK